MGTNDIGGGEGEARTTDRSLIWTEKGPPRQMQRMFSFSDKHTQLGSVRLAQTSLTHRGDEIIDIDLS